MDECSDESYYAVIVRIILSVLQVVAMDNSGLSLVCFYFPIIEVNLFQQFLFMELQFAHC